MRITLDKSFSRLNLINTMEFEQDQPRQSQQFDKIFRENMNGAFGSIENLVLKLGIISMEDLPESLMQTKERRTDVLKRVIDKSGKIFILHIEYQSTNDGEMLYRMAEYSIMIQKKYRCEVKQYVIFVGSRKLNMISAITSEDFTYKYNLISFHDIDYNLFLNNNKPEEIIIAIFCNFGEDNRQTAVNNIINRIQSTVIGELDKSKYLTQLGVFVKLRNLQPEYKIAMESLSTLFKEEEDLFYQIGEKKGKIEGKIEGEHNAYLTVACKLVKMNMPIELIAEATNLPIEEIKKHAEV